jgi:hypothetical protein
VETLTKKVNEGQKIPLSLDGRACYNKGRKTIVENSREKAILFLEIRSW